MSAGAFFLGIESLGWLGIGLAVWTAVTFRFRPGASLRALAAALGTAVAMGLMPGLAGWRSLGGLLFGLGLAALGSTVAAWQTMIRLRSNF